MEKGGDVLVARIDVIPQRALLVFGEITRN
jgi:hypothetical protein